MEKAQRKNQQTPKSNNTKRNSQKRNSQKRNSQKKQQQKNTPVEPEEKKIIPSESSIGESQRPEGTTPAPFNMRVRFKMRKLFLTFTLHHIPHSKIRVDVQEDHVVFDTLEHTKKFWNYITFPDDIRVSEEGSTAEFNGNTLTVVLPIVQLVDKETGNLLRKKSKAKRSAVESDADLDVEDDKPAKKRKNLPKTREEEVERQMALALSIGDAQEDKVQDAQKREKRKQDHFREKRNQKMERKKKNEQIRNKIVKAEEEKIEKKNKRNSQPKAPREKKVKFATKASVTRY
eukprot:TRINITY_DN1723_c0_g1_i2.p1 TRINITY_DN1723_c0_g1~~TRINITY_DN1723_c0_g1_i2.p1  ORF type:complete len:298 (-),score=92.86 TRINITY_DN1723_c0_g1_i2:925-1791(-)